MNFVLSTEQKETLQKYGHDFKEWIVSSEGKKQWGDHHKREKYFKQNLSQKNLKTLTEDEFAEIWKTTWLSRLWHDKDQYVKNKLIAKNGIENLRKELITLLYGSDNFVSRYDNFREKIWGFGVGLISEILNMVFPEKYCLWNTTPKRVFPFLEIFSPPINLDKTSNLTGEEYQQCIEYLNSIRNELINYGVKDFVDLDLFFWYILVLCRITNLNTTI